MKTDFFLTSFAARSVPLGACGLAAALLAAVPAAAADKPAASTYEQERAVCLSGKSQQDRATCLREANNARADAKQGGLDDKGAHYRDNASQRCAALRGDDQRACIARMQGQGTVSGDVKSGGILRERVERSIPASAAAPAVPTGGASAAANPAK